MARRNWPGTSRLRLLAVCAAIAWGVVELVALQRSRMLLRRTRH